MKHFTLFTALLAFSLCLPALTQNKPKSLPKDIPSLKALAEQGDAEAQYMLGAAYYFGEGIDVDFKLGTDWYKKSAKQGNPNAQYSLGAAYWYGKGVPKDRVQTYMWWTLSAGSGHALAKEWMPKITPHLTFIGSLLAAPPLFPPRADAPIDDRVARDILDIAKMTAFKEKKNIMLNLLFLQTGPSQLYKKNILNSKEFKAYSDSKLVIVEWDRGDNPITTLSLMKAYKVRGWPTSLLLDAEGKELVRNTGHLSPAKLIESYKKHEVKKEVEKEDKKEKVKGSKGAPSPLLNPRGLPAPSTQQQIERVKRLAKLGYRLDDYNRMGVPFPPSEENAKLMEFFIKKYPRPVRDHKKSDVKGMFRIHKTKK